MTSPCMDHDALSAAVYRTAADMIRQYGRVKPFVIAVHPDDGPVPLLIPDRMLETPVSRLALPLALRVMLTDTQAAMYAICAQSGTAEADNAIVCVWTGDAENNSAMLRPVQYDDTGSFAGFGGVEEIQPIADSVFVGLLSKKESVH